MNITKKKNDLQQIFDRLEADADTFLENQRKHKIYMARVIAAFLLFLGILYALGIFTSAWKYGFIFGFFLVFLFSFVPVFFSAVNLKDRFYTSYQDRLMEPLFKNILPQNSYQKSKIISQNLFNYSNIFPDEIASLYEGDDLMEGYLDGKIFKFSRLEVKHTDEKVFNGLFFMVDMGNSFEGKTMVVPANHQGVYEEYHPMVFSDKDFALHFKGYTNNESKAMDLLNSKNRNLILEMNEKLAHQLYISCIKKYLFIAIPWPNNLVEQRLKLAIADREKIYLFRDQVRFCLNYFEKIL